MKKFFKTVLAALAMTLLFTISVSAESYKAGGDCGKDLKWSLDYNGHLFIYGTGAMSDFGVWDYTDKGWAPYTSEIKKITLEKGVTLIGNDAFKDCKNLTTVNLPSTLTYISSGAFSDCVSLSDITLPKGLKTIGSHTFSNCISLKNITLPNTLTNLGNVGWGLSTFENTGLTKIVIPSSVTKISDGCFTHCPNLTSVVFNGTEMGVDAFANCPKLTTVKIGNGLKTIPPYAFAGCSMLQNVTIGENVTVIRQNVFQNCSRLREVIIPDRVVTLDSNIFENCSSLEKVTFGLAVNFIGSDEFQRCDALKTVSFCGDAPFFDGNYTFSSNVSLTGHYPAKNKTWDRSKLTAHGAARIDWNTWTPPLSHYAPVLSDVYAGSKGMAIKWKKMSSVKSYEIWRRTGNENYEKIASINSPSTVSWLDKTVGNGKRYTYYIIGINGTQASKQSNSKNLYYLNTNTASAAKNGSSVIVKWKSNSAATGYRIQYATKKDFSNAKTINVKGTKVTSKTIRPGIRGNCYIRVRTYKTVNNVTSYSGWSSTKTVRF